VAAGTRRLGWLAPAPKEGDDKPKTPAGPEALEFRDENSTNFQEGVTTLIPLDRIRSIDYDDNDTVTVRVAAGDKPDADELVKGTTKYRGVNKLTIEAEVDKGELGVAEVKFLGGVAKGIRSVRFPAAKAPSAGAEGRPGLVSVADKKKNEQKAADLQPLYRFADGSERLVPVLLFKKTLKLDVAKISKLRASEGKEADGLEWGVTLRDGEEETLTLLPKGMIDDKEAVLEGLLGRVPAGYKLFPMHTIAGVQFDEPKP